MTNKIQKERYPRRGKRKMIQEIEGYSQIKSKVRESKKRFEREMIEQLESERMIKRIKFGLLRP